MASAVNNDVARAGGLIAVALLPALSGLSGHSYLHPAEFSAGFRHAVVVAGCGVARAAGCSPRWWCATPLRRGASAPGPAAARVPVCCPLEATPLGQATSAPPSPTAAAQPVRSLRNRLRDATRHDASWPGCDNGAMSTTADTSSTSHTSSPRASAAWTSRAPSSGPRSAPSRRSARPAWPTRCWACSRRWVPSPTGSPSTSSGTRCRPPRGPRRRGPTRRWWWPRCATTSASTCRCPTTPASRRRSCGPTCATRSST